jgi:hypothetical protein
MVAVGGCFSPINWHITLVLVGCWCLVQGTGNGLFLIFRSPAFPLGVPWHLESLRLGGVVVPSYCESTEAPPVIDLWILKICKIEFARKPLAEVEANNGSNGL